jgi:hypothetical protein
VGAKIIIPAIPAMTVAMTEALKPFVGLALAGAFAGAVVILLPGIFGFAVWEFKENWKLYQANRSKKLRPIMIGHHGETMARLLRPGFHSGTVPKTFARLRRAVRAGNAAKAHKHRTSLHHVTEAVYRFAERELLALLKLSKQSSNLPIEVGDVTLATNRIRVRFLNELGNPLVVSFALRSGNLEAVTDAPGWLTQLSQEQAAVVHMALAGWYQLAGATACVSPKTQAADSYGISWEAWVAAWSNDLQGQ